MELLRNFNSIELALMNYYFVPSGFRLGLDRMGQHGQAGNLCDAERYEMFEMLRGIKGLNHKSFILCFLGGDGSLTLLKHLV